MAKTGRPRKEIDQKEFEKLCELQCTHDEICAWFETTPKTLNSWCKRTYGKNMTFSKVFEEKKGKGKIALRRYQFQQAKKSATMAIWLGKQYLGQTDQMKLQTQAIPVVIENDLEE